MSISERYMKSKRKGVPDEVWLKACYPFDALEEGEAFLVRDISKRAYLSVQAARKKRQLGRQFSVTTCDAGVVVARPKVLPNGARPQQKLRIVSEI